MESNSKRRKLGHTGSGLAHGGLIDFESRDSARLSTASTFVLQTDELLKEAAVDYGKVLQDVDGQLHRLKAIVESISPHEPIPIHEATSKFEKKHRIVVPYPDPKPAKSAPYKLSFAKPAQCNVVGSYALKTMVKSQQRLGIDMVVQMPKSMFQDKDYLNMRFFYRRSYYIAYIAAHVRKELGGAMDNSFEYLNGNPLLPVLVLRPPVGDGETNGKSAKKTASKSTYAIRLIPCAPDDLFQLSKLTSTSNCNRIGDGDDKSISNASPTPFYNSTLKAEASFIHYLRVLVHAKKECPAFVEACALGRIWLAQRGFGGAVSNGGFGHFEWAVMIALLLQTGGRNGQPALSTSLSGTELFKAVIQFLSGTDFNKKPFLLGTSTNFDGVRESGPVMFDPTRELNLLFKMSSWSARLLQLHAKSTTDLLADEAADKFEPIFITKTNAPLLLYDAVFEIKSPDILQPSESADRRGAVWDFSLEAHRVLKKAYGDRAQLVHVQQPSSATWPLNASRPAEGDSVLVGIIFDAPHMSRQMEYGPPAEEQKEASRFRQFWGDKAELRRFKDGSILECVEWSSKLPLQICEEIAHYALRRHLKITKDEISSLGKTFSGIMGLSHIDKEAFDSARKAFQILEYDIRNLEELPLQIRQLSPVSALARYTSIQPPLLGFHKDSIEVMDVNLYFEASSKWPENLVAIQEAKIEFLLDFDRRLTAAHENITTYLGRENRDVGIENLAYLDVVYDSGAAFRLRIHCDLEEAILERQVKNKTLEHHVRDESGEALANFKWLYTTLPLHTQTIATFCTRLHPLSQTIRLVKHWFNSHKLSGHINEELIELFVLHAFLQPYPWRVPTSVTTGFLRTLMFLSRWDWRDEPLIVDSAETLTSAERTAAVKELETWRKRDPGMNHAVLFVATSHDQSGAAYTRTGPSKLGASRMTRLAKAACKLAREHDVRLDDAALFQPSLRDYDILIHLTPKALRAILRDAASEPGARKHSLFKNLDASTGRGPLPVRAHPVDVLVEELQRVFADTLLLFRGASVDDGDAVIGAVWNPKLQAQQRFRAGLPYNFRRVAGGAGGDGTPGDAVEVNRQAVLLEIARAGGELIKKIEEVE